MPPRPREPGSRPNESDPAHHLNDRVSQAPVDPAEAALQALLTAFGSLEHRGVGPEAWAHPLSENPLSFLLDAMHDAVLIRRADGRVVYRNHAAEDLEVLAPMSSTQLTAFEHVVDSNGRSLERRCVRYRLAKSEVLIELVTQVVGPH